MRGDEVIENFEQNSSELYRLAYLLTGNSDRGVEAFSRALDIDEDENPAFGGFMNAWARKLVAVEALGSIEKELRASKQRVARRAGERASEGKWKLRDEITQVEFEEAVIAIDAFPRCAMLLTIFEGMSMKDAALLLHADESLTAAAQRMGIVELTRNLAGDAKRRWYAGLIPVPVLSFN
jgi:hypothetical protein